MDRSVYFQLPTSLLDLNTPKYWKGQAEFERVDVSMKMAGLLQVQLRSCVQRFGGVSGAVSIDVTGLDGARVVSVQRIENQILVRLSICKLSIYPSVRLSVCKLYQ